MKGLTKTVEIDGRTITVRELTVAEVRAWFHALEQADQADAEVDIIAEGLLQGASFADICRVSDLEPDGVDALTPSDLNRLVAAAREVNPDFFSLKDRLVSIGQAALAVAGKDRPVDTGEATPAPAAED